jgi:hypothetical protein
VKFFEFEPYDTFTPLQNAIVHSQSHQNFNYKDILVIKSKFYLYETAIPVFLSLWNGLDREEVSNPQNFPNGEIIISLGFNFTFL